MSQEIKDLLGESPVLTLEPELLLEPEQVTEGESVEQQSVATKEKEPEVILTPEEQAMVADFVEKIDLTNSNMILQYGAGAQKKIAKFSESALDNVRTKDLGEVGQMLGDIVSELKSLEVEEEEKGFFSFFKNSGNKLAKMKLRYDKAEVNVNRICSVLEQHQIQLLKDVTMLDKMYDLNTTYFKELSMYILAGKQKLEVVQNEELPALVAKAERTGLHEDVQAANDLASLYNRFEKKLHDLELTRMVALQMAPQIRLVQSNDTVMAEKIQSTLVNTIPLWKSQMVLAIGINHSEQAAKAQRDVTDMTNQLLRKNAEVLKTATIETAKESERGIVDMETLKHTNASLIATLDEVMRIQTEGKEKRRVAEAELTRLESELKDKLLTMSR